MGAEALTIMLIAFKAGEGRVKRISDAGPVFPAIVVN